MRRQRHLDVVMTEEEWKDFTKKCKIKGFTPKGLMARLREAWMRGEIHLGWPIDDGPITEGPIV